MQQHLQVCSLSGGGLCCAVNESARTPPPLSLCPRPSTCLAVARVVDQVPVQAWGGRGQGEGGRDIMVHTVWWLYTHIARTLHLDASNHSLLRAGLKPLAACAAPRMFWCVSCLRLWQCPVCVAVGAWRCMAVWRCGCVAIFFPIRHCGTPHSTSDHCLGLTSFVTPPPFTNAPPQIVHTIRGSSDAPLDVPVSGWDPRDALPRAAGGGASLLPAAGSGDAALAPVYNLQAAVVRDTA